MKKSKEKLVAVIVTVIGKRCDGCESCAASKGPAKVNSPAFRDGWNRIFEKKSDNLPN